jgi:hypothetical protein
LRGLILKHLDLWDLKARPPPKANALPMAPQYHIDNTDSQVPVSDHYFYVDPQYPEVYPPMAGLHRLIFEERDGFKGKRSPNFLDFLPSWQDQDPREPSRYPRPSLAQAWSQPSISASELPPQHHEVEFGLTHKGNVSDTPAPKSDFLSKVVQCIGYHFEFH